MELTPDVTRTSAAHGLATMADQELQRVLEALQQREKEVEKLRAQLKEVLHINRQWDIEYRDLQHKFELYQQDAQQAQHENHSFIEQLKEQKEQMMEDMRTLETRRTGGGGGGEEELLKELESLREDLSKMKEGKEKLERKLNEARAKYDSMKHHYEEAVKLKLTLTEQLHQLQEQQHPGAPEETKKMAQLQEEVSFLHQQLKVYKEDFEAESRDRQRITRERDSDKLHYQSEVTSLQLQLDRCRGELARFQMEASRLAQQLRLRRQAEQEQFRKHLENKGYAPRYPNQPLPPLDPFVENDVPAGYCSTPMGTSTAQPSAYAYAGRVVAQSRSDSSQLRRVGPMLLRCRDTQEGKDIKPAGNIGDAPLPLLPNEIADLKLNSSERLAPHSSVPGSSTLLLTGPPASGTAFKYSCPRCQKEMVKFDGFCADCVSSSQ